MTDQRIVPIDNVQRAIRRNLSINWTEITIVAHYDWIDFGTHEPGTFFAYLVVQYAAVTDAIGDQEISLHVIGEVTAGDHRATAKRPGAFLVKPGK